MDDKIQNKWDQFKSKEEEYLKMNEQIEERRKNIQNKLNQKEQESNNQADNDVDLDDEQNYNEDQYDNQDGEYDEFGLNENEYNQEQDEEQDQPKEFSNRDYINKIIQRVNNEDDDVEETINYKKNKNKLQLNKDEEQKQENDIDDDDDDEIDAEKLLKKQEQLEEKLNKYKKIDSKKNEELIELEMLVEEQGIYLIILILIKLTQNNSKEKIIRVQRIRKDGLLSEIDSLQDTLKVKESILSQLGEKGKSFEEETESYQVQINLLNEKMEETKKMIVKLGQQKQQEDKDCKSIQNEIDQVKKEIKKKGVELNKKDIKINRLQEEIDKIKMNLQINKGNTTSDKQGDAKKINEKLHSDIKKLDRQIQELLNAFKKQLRLIDILKRQKNHLIAGQIFAYTEEQFVSAIEMGQKI
ncbi:hypothetical protein ABPG74_005821 [Tetrahymena malaccensis]